MPQSIWTGSISFGLVNIPVKLFSAVSRKTVHFNQLDVRTNARVKQKRVSSEDGVEVPYEQIVKGYELDSGNYVVITDDELAALDPKALRTIDIDEFVDLADIDPIFFDSAYYLAPDKADKPYALLARAMEESGKIGVAHFVMRSKRYLAAVRPKDGKLLLSTMVYADEIRPPEEIPGLAELDEVELSDKELEMARQLVDSLGAPFEPDKFHDTYREAVLELIDRKASGDETVATPLSDDEPDKVIDLMAALEASVAAAKQARGRHPTGSTRKAAAKKASATGRPRRRQRRKKAPAKKSAAAKKGGGQEDDRGIGHAHPQVGLGRPGGRGQRGRDRRPPAQAVEPGQGALSRGGVHQGPGHRLLRPGGPGHAHPRVGPVRDLPPVPQRRRRQVVLREAVPVAPPGVGGGGAGSG